MPDATHTPLLLKPADAAKALAISPRLLWSWTNRNDGIPCIRIGRAVRYDPDDLRRWIEENKLNGSERKK